MYELRITQAAARALRKAPREAALRIRRKLEELRTDPFQGSNVKRLTAHPGYRLRVGDWRVLYLVQEEILVIQVIEIGHRREVYR